MESLRYIKPETLFPYVGDNKDVILSLIGLFKSELTRFKEQLVSQPTEDEFLEIRKGHHSISPSLKMFQLLELEELIEKYKKTVDPAKKEAGYENNISELLLFRLNEIITELSSFLK